MIDIDILHEDNVATFTPMSGTGEAWLYATFAIRGQSIKLDPLSAELWCERALRGGLLVRRSHLYHKEMA